MIARGVVLNFVSDVTKGRGLLEGRGRIIEGGGLLWEIRCLFNQVFLERTDLLQCKVV